MNYGGEFTLAEGADSLHLRPLQQAGEAELVEAGVGHGLVVHLSQADWTSYFTIRR